LGPNPSASAPIGPHPQRGLGSGYSGPNPHSLVPEQDAASLPVDPVCHMAVDPERAAARQTLGDIEYFLCSPECARAFASDPGRYIGLR
jgi:YHS domain-containing protein